MFNPSISVLLLSLIPLAHASINAIQRFERDCLKFSKNNFSNETVVSSKLNVLVSQAVNRFKPFDDKPCPA